MTYLLCGGWLVFVRGTGLTAKLVMWGTRSKRNPHVRVSHTAIATGFRADIIEANPEGVQVTDLYDRYADGAHDVAIYRSRNIPGDKLQAIVDHAAKRIGRKYGFRELLGHAVRNKFLGGDTQGWLARQVAKWCDIPDEDVCSENVAAAYDAFAAEGYTFGVAADSADPDVMLDFCEANPDKWECMMPLGRLEP